MARGLLERPILFNTKHVLSLTLPLCRDGVSEYVHVCVPQPFSFSSPPPIFLFTHIQQEHSLSLPC